MPAVAAPYIGRFLDLSLFDLTGIGRPNEMAGCRRVSTSPEHGRSYPGLTLTGRNGKTGYFTTASCAGIWSCPGGAVGVRPSAGPPGTAALFGGVTGIGLDVPERPPRSRGRTTAVTLNIKVLDRTENRGKRDVQLVDVECQRVLPTVDARGS